MPFYQKKRYNFFCLCDFSDGCVITPVEFRILSHEGYGVVEFQAL
jgi:hypothetical protein